MYADPSAKLGILPWWAWLIDLSPGWAFWVILLASPVAIKFLLRPLVEGRIIPRRQEFMSFHCDMFFAPAFAAGLVLVRAMPERYYAFQGTVWHLVIIAATMTIWALHAWAERNDYTLRQWLSPTKIYHEMLFMGVGYPLAAVVVFGSFLAPWTFEMIVMRGVAWLSLGIWAASWPFYDEKHKHDPLDADGNDRYCYAHVEDGWPWQHQYRHLGDWWALYAADWREVPGRIARLWNRLTG